MICALVCEIKNWNYFKCLALSISILVDGFLSACGWDRYLEWKSSARCAFAAHSKHSCEQSIMLASRELQPAVCLALHALMLLSIDARHKLTQRNWTLPFRILVVHLFLACSLSSWCSIDSPSLIHRWKWCCPWTPARVSTRTMYPCWPTTTTKV